MLASQLMAAELRQEGFGYFAARSDAAPADALSLALAGAFESRLDSRTSRRSPSMPELLDLRQSVLQRLVERNQLLDPVKFAYYAGLAGLELAPPG